MIAASIRTADRPAAALAFGSCLRAARLSAAVLPAICLSATLRLCACLLIGGLLLVPRVGAASGPPVGSVAVPVELGAALGPDSVGVLDRAWMVRDGDAWRPVPERGFPALWRETSAESIELILDWTADDAWVDRPLVLRARALGTLDLSLNGRGLKSFESPAGESVALTVASPGPHRLRLRWSRPSAGDGPMVWWLARFFDGDLKLQFGEAEAMMTAARRELLRVMGVSVVGSAFALGFGMLHALLFFLYRRELGRLMFSLFAVGLAVNGSAIAALEIVGLGLVGRAVGQTVIMLGAATAIGAVVGFLCEVRRPGTSLQLVQRLGIAFSPALVLLIAAPPRWSLLYGTVWMLAVFGVAVYQAQAAWRERVRGRRFLLLSLAGFMLLMIGPAIPWEVGIVSAQVVGVLLLLLGSSMILADRLTRVFRRAELRAQDLERLVVERTTELRASEREARAASRAKSSFLATVSHEIRTPMNAIVGIGELLADAPEPKRRRLLETLGRSTRSLLTLIDEILDISRIESGRLDLARQPFDPAALVREAVDLMRVDAELRSDLTLTSQIDPELPQRLLGDRPRLRQILLNLLGNALKFTDRGSIEVAARWASATETLMLEVRDTGHGVPEEAQERIFQAFVQADDSSRRQSDGAGLGLAICRELVERMGGSITLDSEVGRGSTFSVRVPAPRADDAPPAESPAVASPLERSTLHVLLAEDNEVNQLVVQMMLETLGHQVTIAGGGAEAINLSERERFDVLLLDLHMPEIDGFAVTEVLRRRGDTLPIVALTASATEDTRRRCLDAGMDGFLTKPVERSTLERSLAEVVARTEAASRIA
ncbi:MAG: ATP-binding protein [Acidobacteriota bacterium]